MEFRWKTQDTVAPVAPQTMPQAPQAFAGVPGAQPALQAAPDGFEEIRARIGEKEARLAEIEARIAEIDRQYPQLKNGGQEWEIAAKRAEIGDMSAYDSMMARGQQAGGNAKNIESEIQKAYIDLSYAGPEQRPAFQNRINALEKEYREATGKDYVFDGADVKRGLTEGGDTSVTLSDVKSKLMTMKDKKGYITRDQEKELMADLQKMPFSDDLVNFYNEIKATTIKEDADAAKGEAKKKANSAIDEAVKNFSYSDLVNGNGSYSKKASNGKTVTVTRAANGDIIYECNGVKRTVKGGE